MAHDTRRIIDTISDATSKLSDIGVDHQQIEAVNEFIDVLLSNFAYTFSEDSDDYITHREALTNIRERFHNWL